ncbi:unnamed protein product [Nesidiocoris tenuis]|uniref:Uncharacterized protein n=1 Tax=Nesidiocoris tenuis TaxID=355587 RepID=A0A6H5H8D0_9HEMI|nr:unnamed protein product [Nesidiocoris tenuis]
MRSNVPVLACKDESPASGTYLRVNSRKRAAHRSGGACARPRPGLPPAFQNCTTFSFSLAAAARPPPPPPHNDYGRPVLARGSTGHGVPEASRFRGVHRGQEPPAGGRLPPDGGQAVQSDDDDDDDAASASAAPPRQLPPRRLRDGRPRHEHDVGPGGLVGVVVRPVVDERDNPLSLLQAHGGHDRRLLYRLPHRFRRRPRRQHFRHHGRLPVAQDAQRHQFLHRQSRRCRHSRRRFLSAGHTDGQHLCSGVLPKKFVEFYRKNAILIFFQMATKQPRLYFTEFKIVRDSSDRSRHIDENFNRAKDINVFQLTNSFQLLSLSANPTCT